VAVLTFIVPDEWDGFTLSEFARKAHGVSGTTLKMAKRIENGITLDGEHIRTVDPVKAGGVVRIVVDANAREYKPLDIDVPVLYEDESFVAFDKPAGLAVHPSAWHAYDTLANVYAARKETSGLVFRPVGRLDRNTSGVVLCAKNAHTAYNTRMTEKRYTALVSGKFTAKEGTIDAPIGREGEDSRRRCVRDDGQRAVTHYRVLREYDNFSLVEFLLETGRTHQIRVHAAYMGCPLLGDELYGGDMSLMSRHALHCTAVSFYHPTEGKTVRVESAIPADMLEIMRKNEPCK